jgi:hypothetical protein
MTAPHEAGHPRESVVRAVFAPDTYLAHPQRPAQVRLILDNHDTQSRAVVVEMSGPLARHSKPRRLGKIDLPPRRQHPVDVKVSPGARHPEGDQHYDLTALMLDPVDRTTVLFSTSVRIGVEPVPSFRPTARPAKPAQVTDQRGNVVIEVEVWNDGNVPLTLDVVRFPRPLWVRAGERGASVKIAGVRRYLSSGQPDPRTPEDFRPDQRRIFEVGVTPPRYLIGFGRTWLVPIGVHGVVIRGDRVSPEFVLGRFEQLPTVKVERRMAYLAIAVVGALLVLAIFMAVLATSGS